MTKLHHIVIVIVMFLVRMSFRVQIAVHLWPVSFKSPLSNSFFLYAAKLLLSNKLFRFLPCQLNTLN